MSDVSSVESAEKSTPEFIHLSNRDTNGLTRIIFWMSLPVFLEQILILLVSTSDYLITGRFLETPHIAAICSAGYIIWAVQSLFCFVSVGATAMTARYIGAGVPDKANKAAHQAFIVGSAITLFFFAIWFTFSNQIVTALNLEGDACKYASNYLWIILPTTPFIMLSGVGLASLRGAGNMACGFWIMLIVNIINITVSWALVIGIGPIPSLGFNGVALGTALGFIIGGLATLYLLFRGSFGLKLDWRLFRPDWSMIRQLLWISIPAGIDMATIIGCQLWFLGLINSLGIVAAAVHGVALRVESWGFAPLCAFQMAATTLAGQFLGARRPKMAIKSANTIMIIAGIFVSFASTILFIGADFLPYIFLKSDQTVLAAQAAPLLVLVGYALPASVVMMVISGVLRGSGDTRVPMIISLIGFLFIRISLTYYLAFDRVSLLGYEFTGLNMGVVGAWIGMTSDITVRALLLFARYLQGGWMKIRIE